LKNFPWKCTRVPPTIFPSICCYLFPWW
jgi:hypothetical protein